MLRDVGAVWQPVQAGSGRDQHGVQCRGHWGCPELSRHSARLVKAELSQEHAAGRTRGREVLGEQCPVGCASRSRFRRKAALAAKHASVLREAEGRAAAWPCAARRPCPRLGHEALQEPSLGLPLADAEELAAAAGTARVWEQGVFTSAVTSWWSRASVVQSRSRKALRCRGPLQAGGAAWPSPQCQQRGSLRDPFVPQGQSCSGQQRSLEAGVPQRT